MVSNLSKPSFERHHASALRKRLAEPRRFLQVVAGPRQVGKTTLVGQVAARLRGRVHTASADEPLLKGSAWLAQQWDIGRDLARAARARGAVLVLDEIQKVHGWSETVKRLWDEDTRTRLPLRVVVLGSAPLLVQAGLTESLAGRFEVLHLPHWSFDEMRSAFGFTLDQFIFHGGYPGAAPLVDDVQRWRRYILDSLVETTISRDVLLMSRVEKPALLRRLLDIGCRYSGQILSYTKMLGQLHDAGNTTTLAHYLDLLAGAGMLTGLQKFAGQTVRARGSSPKLQVLNTALMTAAFDHTLEEAQADREFWGRLTESAIGAHLANAAATGRCELFYWRDRNREVDFVIRARRQLVAIEVKTGRARDTPAGVEAFAAAFRPRRSLLIGRDGISVEDFLSRDVEDWMR